MPRPCRSIVAAAVGAIGFGGMFVAPDARAQTILTLNHYMPANHPFVKQIVGPWGKKVEEVTQGRVKLEIPRAPLTPVQAQWSSVETGVADVAIVNDAFERQRLRLMQLAYLPGMGDASSKTSWALWRTYDKFFKSASEYKGVKLIGIWAQPGTHVYTNNEPIKSIDDFKSLKLVANPGIGASVATALGASAVTSAGPASFEVISKGVADGLIFPTVAISLFKLDKYLKYETRFPGGLYSGTWSVIMNINKWNAISDADKKAIDALSPDAIIGEGGKYWDERTRKAQTDIAKTGIKTVQASPELFAAVRQQLAPIEEAWIKDATAKGIDAKAAIAYFRDQVK
jgi:TRAP-type C4-dicarboxylate transport system substrate-binding protein